MVEFEVGIWCSLQCARLKSSLLRLSTILNTITVHNIEEVKNQNNQNGNF